MRVTWRWAVAAVFLWVALAGVAYYFFAQVFGWPWPFG